MFRGELCQFLKAANTDPNWRKLIGRKHLDKHQRDVEFVLRVLALTSSSGEYEKPMKEFLNSEMSKNITGKSQSVRRFFKAFPTITRTLANQLGEKPFHIRGPLNISVLDSVMAVLLEHPQKTNKLKGLKEKYESLINDAEFLEAATVNTTDTKTVNTRLGIVRRALLGD